jgi:hypothetical protein
MLWACESPLFMRTTLPTWTVSIGGENAIMPVVEGARHDRDDRVRGHGAAIVVIAAAARDQERAAEQERGRDEVSKQLHG